MRVSGYVPAMGERWIAGAQAVYYAGTGIWSLVDRRGFEAVAGRKRDYWLVQTVGTLVTSIGAALGVAALRKRVAPELRLLGVASAVGLAAIDVRHATAGRIGRIYLADAAAQLALVAAWAAARRGMRGR